MALLDRHGRAIAPRKPTITGVTIAQLEHRLTPAKSEMWSLVERADGEGFQFAAIEDFRLVARGPAVRLEDAGELALSVAAGDPAMPPQLLLLMFATALAAIHALSQQPDDGGGTPIAQEEERAA